MREGIQILRNETKPKQRNNPPGCFLGGEGGGHDISWRNPKHSPSNMFHLLARLLLHWENWWPPPTRIFSRTPGNGMHTVRCALKSECVSWHFQKKIMDRESSYRGFRFCSLPFGPKSECCFSQQIKLRHIHGNVYKGPAPPRGREGGGLTATRIEPQNMKQETKQSFVSSQWGRGVQSLTTRIKINE